MRRLQKILWRPEGADMFKGILLTRVDGHTHAKICDMDRGALAQDEIDIAVSHSSLNYKDALAITGTGQVVRSWPMVPGIDCIGTVSDSRHAKWTAGDPVLVTGWGLGETSWGGLAERCRINGDWAMHPPASYAARDCMVIGTAGFTAALSVAALQDHPLPKGGQVLVTGATGGVGSIAVLLLAKLGYEVVASTGRIEQEEYLRSLGAVEIVDRKVLSTPGRPLAKERWHGVVDTVGGATLASACAATRWNGAVAACGLAGAADFSSTVMPFILRGITLYGINSVFTDNAKRSRVWTLLAEHVDKATLQAISRDIALDEVIAFAPSLLAGQVRGRTVVVVKDVA